MIGHDETAPSLSLTLQPEQDKPPTLVGVSNPTGPKTYSSTFPADLPSDLDDASVIAAHDQRAFQDLDAMLCHWDRPYRPSYHWLIPVGDELAAIDLATRCQSYLPDDGLDPTPGPWIHLTLKRAGYQDELRAAEIEPLVAGVADRVSQIPRFRIQLIPLAGSPGAVRLSVAPWQPLMDLVQALDVEPSTQDLTPHSVFRPHVGVAYSAKVQQPGLIQAAVRLATEELPPVEVEIKRLSFVAMRRAGGWYEWNELKSVPIAGNCSA